MNRFGRSLRFLHLEFDNEAISNSQRFFSCVYVFLLAFFFFSVCLFCSFGRFFARPPAAVFGSSGGPGRSALFGPIPLKSKLLAWVVIRFDFGGSFWGLRRAPLWLAGLPVEPRGVRQFAW